MQAVAMGLWAHVREGRSPPEVDLRMLITGGKAAGRPLQWVNGSRYTRVSSRGEWGKNRLCLEVSHGGSAKLQEDS